MNSMEEANSERHYLLLVLAIIVGIIGIYLRFVDFKHASLVANIIFAIGIAWALKIVVGILK
jgi:hypothetical protein